MIGGSGVAFTLPLLLDLMQYVQFFLNLASS